MVYRFCAAVYYIKNKDNTSDNYYEMFKLFPTSFKNFPLFYPQVQIDKLKNTFFLDNLNIDVDILIDIFNILQKEFKEIQFKRIDILKAFYLVNSRNIYLEELKKKAIVPVADLINHNLGGQNAKYSFNKETDSFEVKASQNIEEGKEIFFEYGLLGNNQLFLNYGFTADDAFDGTEIKISLENKDKLFLSKFDTSIADNSYKVAKKNQNPIHNLLVFAVFIQDVILGYPTNMLDDDKILASNKLKGKDLNVIRVIIEEKEVIYNAYDVLNSVIYLLTHQDDKKIRENKNINNKIWEVIEKHSDLIKKEIEKHKYIVHQVETYDVYNRKDIGLYIEDLINLFADFDHKKERKSDKGN